MSLAPGPLQGELLPGERAKAASSVADEVAFGPALLAWFDEAGRKNLPWQRDPTPYRVWISEIMLQQTQVATVSGYYERFLKRFPDVATLAAGPLDAVLHLWSGLGYYARARNLHKAAGEIVERFGGEFPGSLPEVESLPGIGRSTAAAILALSRDERHPILDGNVKRVLARYAGIHGFPGTRETELKLWSLAERLMPAVRAAHYTQAIMDLGATLCVRSKPACNRCPVREGCVACANASQSTLPTPRPRKVRPSREVHVVIAVGPTGVVLLERRPPTGIWGGLWGFPQLDSPAAVKAWMSQPPLGGLWPGAAVPAEQAFVRWDPHPHAFTHFDLAMHPWVVAVDDARMAIADADRYCWYDPLNPDEIGLAAPVTELIARLGNN